MSPIKIPLPQNEQSCFPTTTELVIQCYSDNMTLRTTYRYFEDNNQNGWIPTARDRQYNYGTYSPTGSALAQYYPYSLPVVTGFWFKLISCIMVAFIFYFVYRVLFRRFIK